jgi:hypothetical protein
MFRALLAYPQEALQNRRVGDCCVRLKMWAGLRMWEDFPHPETSPRSGDRIPEGARFFAHLQTGPEAYPASCTIGTGSFPGVKRPGRGADHPPPSSAEVKKEYSYTSTHPLGQFRPVMGRLYDFTTYRCHVFTLSCFYM